MKTLAAILAVTLALAGCATPGLQDWRDRAASTENAAICQTADAVTTIFALGKGGAEANPIMAKVISTFGFPGMFLVKAAIVYAVYLAHENPNMTETQKNVIAATNVTTCAVAAHNAIVVRNVRKIPPVISP